MSKPVAPNFQIEQKIQHIMETKKAL